MWSRPRQAGGGGGGGAVTVLLPARFATTGNVNLVGGAPLLPDGPNPVANGNRILVWQQILAAENGLYVVQNAGTGADGTWVRSQDFDTAVEAEQTTGVYVQEGAAYHDTLFTLITDPPIVIGVTPLVFAIYPAATAAGVLVDFAWNSPSPLLLALLMGSDVVEWAKVILTVPFDDPTASLLLGHTANPSSLFVAGEVDVTKVGVYTTEEPLRLGVPSNFLLTVNPAASSQGAGYVLARIRR
jgi:hypothetical protein